MIVVLDNMFRIKLPNRIINSLKLKPGSRFSIRMRKNDIILTIIPETSKSDRKTPDINSDEIKGLLKDITTLKDRILAG